SAASASAPSAAIFTVAPFPAASIITPMMLFALTRRPLRESQMSLRNPLATCVSFAAARACRPRRLTIAASTLGIQASIRIHMHDTFRARRQRALHRCTEGAIAAGKDAQQHGQRDARDPFDVVVGKQARDDVARRRAEYVGEDQHAVAGVDLLYDLARAQHQVIRVVLAPDRERRHLRRPAAEDLVRAR